MTFLFTGTDFSVYNAKAHFPPGGDGASLGEVFKFFMEKDVIISIKGVQRYENAEADTMELVTAGRLEREGNS